MPLRLGKYATIKIIKSESKRKKYKKIISILEEKYKEVSEEKNNKELEELLMDVLDIVYS